MTINLDLVVPIPGLHLPKDFKKAVALLARPYIPISEKEYQRILAITIEPATDIVTYRGRQMTFGEADGGYALMPLIKPLQTGQGT